MWTKPTEQLMRFMATQDIVSDFVLVGGSALSYYLKHRSSEDLDLFSSSDILNKAKIDQWVEKISKHNHSVKKILDESQVDYIIDGVKVSFCGSGLPCIHQNKKTLFNKLHIADLKVLTALKAKTIGSRSETRDYHDMAVLVQDYGLQCIINATKEIFPNFNVKLFLAQLVYFSDLENNLSAHLIFNRLKTMGEVKSTLIDAVKNFSAETFNSLDPAENCDFGPRL